MGASEIPTVDQFLDQKVFVEFGRQRDIRKMLLEEGGDACIKDQLAPLLLPPFVGEKNAEYVFIQVRAVVFIVSDEVQINFLFGCVQQGFPIDSIPERATFSRWVPDVGPIACPAYHWIIARDVLSKAEQLTDNCVGLESAVLDVIRQLVEECGVLFLVCRLKFSKFAVLYVILTDLRKLQIEPLFL
jgi:hypothetical protein